MGWVSSSPSFHVPLPKGLVALATIPQTPLLALATNTAILICHAQSLIPISVHERRPDCIETHGKCVELSVRHVSVDSTHLDRLHTANFFVRTELSYVLVYHIFVNYSNSLYEVHDKNDDAKPLQNSLPLVSSSKFSLASLFKSATKSILQGGHSIVNLENTEHFNNGANDDEQRNDVIPLVKISMVKVLRTNAPLRSFWCKSNSQTLIFHNEQEEIQILNMKTARSVNLNLYDYHWFEAHSLVSYNLSENRFLFIDPSLYVSLVEFVTHDDKVSLEQHPLLKLETKVEDVLFNPSFDLCLLHTDTSYDLYKLNYTGKKRSMHFVKTVYSSENPVKVHWSPCGTFLVVVEAESGFWKLFSRFGATLFDSSLVVKEIAAGKPEEEISKSLGQFCQASDIIVSPNALRLYVVDKAKKNLYVLPLTASQQSASQVILFDENYIRLMRENHTFLNVPLVPHFQKTLARFHHINGTSAKLSIRRPTGQFTIRKNRYNQLSISYGDRISISTPVENGSEACHALWFNFVNHYMEAMNVVDHYWVDEYLVLINRFVREDIDDDGVVDLMADEVVILNTAGSRLGAGGASFKFDTELIAWRHHLKSKILNLEVQDATDQNTKLLVLLTSDSKIVIMELSSKITDAAKKLSIGIRRSIQLSSIQHKLSITLVTEMAMAESRHFFFLLSTGDFLLLKNQHSEDDLGASNGSHQPTHMYELVKICGAVESFRSTTIDFGSFTRSYVTLMTSDKVIVYKTGELIDRVFDFVKSPNHSSGNGKRLMPIEVQLSSMFPLAMQQRSGAIEVTGFEYQVLLKSEHLLLKYRPSRQLVSNKFIQHDLFESNLDVNTVVETYKDIPNFDYCLELLLFDFIDNDTDEDLEKVVKLVSNTPRADNIFVNLLRKIEVCYWHKFFQLLNETPLSYMNRLIDSQDVELCYSYIIVYLNFKKDYEASETAGEDQAILDKEDRGIILRIIGLLKSSEKWDQCFELCRFLKLLEPSGELLKDIRAQIQ